MSHIVLRKGTIVSNFMDSGETRQRFVAKSNPVNSCHESIVVRYNIFYRLLVIAVFSVFQTAAQADGIQQWVFDYSPAPYFLSKDAVANSPAVGPDGTIYVGSNDSNVYALQWDGVKKWAFPTGAYTPNRPDLTGPISPIVVGPDGTIYVAAYNFVIYAIAPDGSMKWIQGILETGPPQSLVLSEHGTLYVGSTAYLYAFNDDGSIKWTLPGVGYSGRLPRAIGSDGTVYIAGMNPPDLYAVNPDGSSKWVSPGLSGRVAIGADGTLYVYSGNALVAVDPEGKQLWSTPVIGIGTGGSASIGPDNTIYVVSSCGLLALEPRGEILWSFLFATCVGSGSSPAIGADGTIFFGTLEGKLYAVNPDGTLRWIFQADGAIDASPTISPRDGTVYVTSSGGHLYSVDSDTGGLAASNWPMFQQGIEHAAQAPTLSISPTKGGDIGSVTIIIRGSGFVEGTSVRLVRVGEPDIVGTSIIVSSDNAQINAAFDLQGVSLGLWDVIMVNPDGLTQILPQGFTVEPGIPARLWVDIVGRDAIRLGRAGRYNIQFGNIGNVDLQLAQIWLTGIPLDADVTLNFDRAVIPFPDGIVDFSSSPVLIQSSDQKILPIIIPGILAGTSDSLEVLITPNSNTSFNLQVHEMGQ